jgi:hypothetical protein
VEEAPVNQAIRKSVIIQTGGTIRLVDASLPVGRSAEVIVLFEDGNAGGVSLAALMGTAHGGFPNPAEVDVYIREERDSWR